MPPSAKAPAVDAAFCDRTCRVAQAFHWQLIHASDSGLHTYTFVSRKGVEVEGATLADPAAALTSACRSLAEHLI